MTPIQVGEEVINLAAAAGGRGTNHVTISGGDPVIHRGVGHLIGYLHRRGWRVSVETQGAFFPQDWERYPNLFTVSPKPPSSGEEADLFMFTKYVEHAQDTGTDLCVKIVVDPDDDRDWKFADKVNLIVPPEIPIYIMPCNHPGIDPCEQSRKVMDRAIKDMWQRMRVMPQLHVLAWGNERGK